MSVYQFSIYEEATGRYVKTVSAPDFENVGLNVEEGQVAYEGAFDENTYLDTDGYVKAIPPNNNQFAVWDWATKAWVDNMTYDQKLQQLRAEAVLTKLEFLQGMVSAGLLNSTDASDLAMNRLTPSIEAHLTQNVSQPVRERALMEWASTNVVRRNDKFIVDLMSELMSDQYLDQVFGISVADAEGSA